MRQKAKHRGQNSGGFCRIAGTSWGGGNCCRRHLAALLISAALAFAFIAGCGRQNGQAGAKPPEEITIALATYPGSAPLYIAQEKGFFRDEGLVATLLSHASDLLAFDAMLAGKADFATVADMPLARAGLDAKPFAVVATIAENDRAFLIIARKDRGVLAPEDLKGKKIGVAAGTAAEFMLHIYLMSFLLGPQEVEIVDLAPDKVADALLSGKVDAASTWPPYTINILEGLGNNAVTFSEPGLYVMTYNIATSQELVKEHPERIKKFLRALVRANSYIEENSDKARAITAKNIGMESFLGEGDWRSHHFDAMLDQRLVLTLEDQARWMLKAEPGCGRGIPNFLDFIYSDGLKAVQPEAVRIAGK